MAEFVAYPLAYFQNNVGGTITLWESMLSAGASRIGFSSSCATYGVPKQIPIPEDHPQIPVNPYGESKLFAEKMPEWKGKTARLRWVALCYFNAAGADPEGELGENLGRRDCLEICGVDYPTLDGTAVRDYIHVMDLAAAHVSALGYLAADQESLALNLGTGQGTSVREVVAMVEKVSGRKIPTRYAARRPGDPATLTAKSGLAACVLHWKPGWSSLETIVETAWRWHSAGRMVPTLTESTAVEGVIRA